MSKRIERMIQRRKQLIDKLASEVSDLTDQLAFRTNGYREEEKVFAIKTGRKKSDIKEVPVIEGREYWLEDFIDEDNGSVVTLERSRLVSINGKRVDMSGRPLRIVARLVEEVHNKRAWEEV